MWVHTTFSVGCLTFHNALKFHLYCSEWQDFLLHDWVIFQSMEAILSFSIIYLSVSTDSLRTPWTSRKWRLWLRPGCAACRAPVFNRESLDWSSVAHWESIKMTDLGFCNIDQFFFKVWVTWGLQNSYRRVLERQYTESGTGWSGLIPGTPEGPMSPARSDP